MGLYGEVKDSFGPTTPERAVWDQRAEKELQIYMALRPDSFCEWSVKNRMEELAHEDAHKFMAHWYERAVDEQKAELREYEKKIKAQAEVVNIIIEEDPSIGQRDGPEPIKAKRPLPWTGLFL